MNVWGFGTFVFRICFDFDEPFGSELRAELLSRVVFIPVGMLRAVFGFRIYGLN